MEGLHDPILELCKQPGDDVQSLEALLAMKVVPVEIASMDGMSALHWAMRSGNVKIGSALLAHGSEVDLKGPLGETPLMRAVGQGHLMCVEMLLQRGADINAHSAHGETALHWALSKGNYRCAEVLLENGADVNARGVNGTTPLHRACSEGDEGLVELLYSYGAEDHHRSTKTNELAVDIACRCRHDFYVRYGEIRMRGLSTFTFPRHLFILHCCSLSGRAGSDGSASEASAKDTPLASIITIDDCTSVLDIILAFQAV